MKCSHRQKELLFGIGVAAILTLVLWDWYQAYGSPAGKIERRSPGEGSYVENLTVETEGMKSSIPYQVQEQRYTTEEAKACLQKVQEEIEKPILGENKSSEYVSKSLSLRTSYKNYAVTVTWESDSPLILDEKGRLYEEKIPENGKVIVLRAVLECQDEARIYEKSVHVRKPKLSKTEIFKEQAKKALEKNDAKEAQEKYVSLPDHIEEKKVRWSKNMNWRGIFLLVFLLILYFLYPLYQQEKIKEHENKRKEQLLRDFPEIVSQMALLCGAGMTIPKAWERIVKNYLEKRHHQGERPAYEAMERAYMRMCSKVPEQECYELFAEECKIAEYLKFASLLVQNARKGTKGMTSLLNMETRQALEERRRRARTKGEEAGTKLLLPMFFLLAIVLVMIIVPAFLAMSTG